MGQPVGADARHKDFTSVVFRYPFLRGKGRESHRLPVAIPIRTEVDLRQCRIGDRADAADCALMHAILGLRVATPRTGAAPRHRAGTIHENPQLADERLGKQSYACACAWRSHFIPVCGAVS